MVDFRKWVLVLAVLAIFVVPATAQVTCTVAASNIPVRAEGLAELVSQINLNCSNGGAVSGVKATFTAFFSTNVTSRLAPSSAGLAAGSTEAVLTPVAPLTGLPVAPATQGILTGTNALVFNNVTIPDGAGSFSLAINNVRVNANAIGAGGSVSVNMSATSSPANTVLFTGTPVATAAIVQTGLVFTANSGTQTNPAPTAFQQCVPAVNKVDVKFTEGFASSFKSVAQEGGVTGLGVVAPPGTATQGTRLFVRFSGIPSNVNIGVPGTITSNATPTPSTAFLVGFDPAAGGTGGTITGPSSSLTANTSGGLSGLFTVPPATPTAVYEVATDTPLTQVEAFTLTISIQTTTGVAVTTSTAPPTVSGGFAPISTVTTGSTTAPIPRFADVANQNITLFSVTACVTNILFPFLTNQAGFDTGVALINTSADNAGGGVPFNTTPQSGTCTVFYFGSVTGGGAVPAPQTTPTINAGQMFAFALSAGGVAGSTSSTVGFQGYAIARCNFQFAHGYAFVSDLGATKLAHGYLAPIIPDRGGSRLAQPFSAGTPAGTGEQLVF